MRKKIIYMICSIFILLLIIFSIFGPLVYQVDPNYTDLGAIGLPPSATHWLGTDELGRDVFARLLYGGRVTLIVGFLASFIKLCISITVGFLAALGTPLVDRVVMRLADAFMSFPFLIIAMSLAAILGPSIKNLIFIIALLSWASDARLIRTVVKKEKQASYIENLRINQFSWMKISITNILPLLSSLLGAMFTISVAQSILMESSLSYLGIGVQPPFPSWGGMLKTAGDVTSIYQYYWVWLPPAIAILGTCLATMTLGRLAKRDSYA